MAFYRHNKGADFNPLKGNLLSGVTIFSRTKHTTGDILSHSMMESDTTTRGKYRYDSLGVNQMPVQLYKSGAQDSRGRTPNNSWDQWQAKLEKDYHYNLQLFGYERMVYKCHCINCGLEFYARRPEANSCSCSCQIAASVKRRKARAEKAKYLKCAYCGDDFIGTRKDAAYCCNAHRQAAYRIKVLQITV